MIISQRSSAIEEAYRYGFNGMEKDDEVKGDGNSYDFGARIYNPRIGRWLSLDPLESKYPDISPYVFAVNNPILFIDPDGRDVDVSTLTDPKHQAALTNLIATEVGRAFIAQFANAGDIIGGVEFESTGNRANDILALNSASVNMGNRRGLTRTYFNENGGFGKRLRSAKSSDAGKTNVIHLIDLKVGLSEEQSTLTLGHESFIHVNEDVKRLNEIERKGAASEYDSFEEAIEDIRSTDRSSVKDHNRLSSGNATELQKYGKQLDEKKGTTKFSKGVKKDEENH
jgi:RHS repeat-associated protein